eukprot:6671346-Pyramimonas_sp.AAC.1
MEQLFVWPGAISRAGGIISCAETPCRAGDRYRCEDRRAGEGHSGTRRAISQSASMTCTGSLNVSMKICA